MAKPRILFLSESLNIGGAEKALVSILKIIDYSKFDVSLLLVSETGAFLEDVCHVKGLKRRYIVKQSANPIVFLINVLKIKAFYKWLPTRTVGNYLCQDHDVVIAFCEGYLTKWVAAATIPCIKIAWVHTDMVENDWPVKSGVFKTVEEEQKAYQRFDDIVAVSKTVASGVSEKFKINRVHTIYNILDTRIIAKAKAAIDRRIKRKLNLVSVGRLEEVKGYRQLIEAIAVLVNELHYDISLCLVGDGSQLPMLKELIESYRLHHHVKLVGQRINPYPYIASADTYICSSHREGFNIAILEAMTLGIPIIATDSVGPREILDGGKYGRLCSDSVEGLVEAISNTYENVSELGRYIGLSKLRAKFYDGRCQMDKINALLCRSLG